MMSRDIIKKHKNVMLWFIANPEKDVWGRDDNSDNWTLTDTPVFSLGSTFVQNDEYAEFRKAEADGKTIQFYTPNHYGKTIEERNNFTEWEDCTMEMFDNSLQYSDTEFRIKPDV